MSDEKLSALETEVAEVISILLELDSENDLASEQLITKDFINRYAQQVERIGETASEAGFPGLQDACLLLQENLVSLGIENTQISQEERDLLEEWPTLLMGYLSSHDNVDAADEIIRHLQTPCWPNPLPEEFSDVLKSLLVSSELPSSETQDGQTTSSDTLSINTPTFDSLNETLSEPSNISTEESISHSSLTADETTIDDLEERLAKLVEISERFFIEEADIQKLALEIKHYDEQLADVGVAAEANGYTGLQELSMLLQENLSYVSHDKDKIKEEELHLLEIWPGLVMVYLENPYDADIVDELIKHLQDPAWSRPLPDIYTETLQSLLKLEPEDSISISTPEVEALTNTNVDQQSTTASVIDTESSLDFVPSWDELLTNSVESPNPLYEQDLKQQDESEIDIQKDQLFDQTSTVLSEPARKSHDDDDTELANGDEVLATEVENYQNFIDEETNTEPSTKEEAFEFSIEQEQIPETEISESTMVKTVTQMDEPISNATHQINIGSDFDDTLATPIDEVVLEEGDALTEDISTLFSKDVIENDVRTDDQQEIVEQHSEPETLSVVNQDFVDLLQQEITEVVDSSEKTLKPILVDENDLEIRQQALSNYSEELSKLVEVSQAIGLAGLHEVCSYIQENQIQFAGLDRLLTSEEKELLTAWPILIFDYLQAPHDQEIATTIIDYLQNSSWPMPMGKQEALRLGHLLNAVQISNELPSDVEERQRHAQPNDVSLDLPEEVNPELLDSLLQELPSQTAEFSSVIQKFVESNGTFSDVDRAQRLAHTLKGAANTVGVAGIANLTHHTEDILIALARYDSLPPQALSETLMNVADCLETMSEALLGMSSPPDDAISILQSVLDWANKIDQEGIPKLEAESPQTSVETPEPVSAPLIETSSDVESEVVTKTPDSIVENKPVASTREGESQTAVPMLRVPAPLIDDLLRLVGESIILTGQVQERINTNIVQAQLVKEQNIVLQQLTAELEQLVDVQGIATALEHQSSWYDSDFDPLEFDQYNELHTVTRRLAEIANDARALDENISDNFNALETLLIDQSHLHRESQEAVLRTRMIPVKTVVPRLQRSVRQTCRLTDKDVNLNVSGSDTLMDTNILSDMLDPLMHVLRNAVDHGIESPETRTANNKPATGKIDLSFTREGNSIVVRCQDDGAGLDYQSIRKVAEQKQLIVPDQPLSEEELNRLILQSGFSTRTHATQVSGRGIGMDAVYNQLLAIKGSINIESKTGEGCLVELRLPVTLISTHALLIRVRKQIFAVSDRGVEQILHANSGELHKVGDILTYQMGDEVYEVVHLETLLKLPADRRKIDRGNRPALLIRDETGTMRAVMIEEIFESRDLVVKSMGDYMPKLPGILGATILGDGSVTPVLDVPELLRTPIQSSSPSTYQQRSPFEPQELQQRLVLIVDDSLSVRRSMQQLVGDAGFDVRTARDGLEAIELLNTIQPDILLVDLEMPRMNGLELTTHIRAQSKTQQLPVIMITSRSTQKHRQEAESAGVDVYITKPVADDILLSHINKALH